MTENFKRENRETPVTSQRSFFDLWDRSENASGGTFDFAAVGEVFDQGGFTGPYCMELEGGIFNTDDADEHRCH